MSYNDSVRRLMNLIGEDESTLTRGGNRPGASATSEASKKLQEKARANPKVMGLLQRVGLKVEDLEAEADEKDIEPFREGVRDLSSAVKGTVLPSQLEKNQKRYNELEDTGDKLQAFANAQDMGTKINVFRGNYGLGNINKRMDLQRTEMGAYEDDMSYVKDKTQSYEDYKRFVQAAMGDEYKGLRGDLYTYGMEKSDTRPEGQMTLDEINSEINALVREITDAKKPREPMRDPMSGMVMPAAPVDVSAQEARLKELYEKLESKDYISSEEAEAAQQSYFDMYREKWGNKMDAQDEQIAEIEDTLRRGYTTDASKPLTSEEYDELLKKQEELQRGMDETKDPILDAYAFGSDEYHITETAGKSVAELIEEKYPGQKTQAQLDGSALAEAAAQENAKLEAEIKQLQDYEGNDGWVADLYYGSKRKEGITQRERQIAANERIIRDVEFFQLQSAEDFAKVAEEGKKKIKVLPGAKTIGQYTMRDGKATIDATWNVLTEDEQNTYAYLLETDPEKATEYWKTLTDDTYGVVPKRKTETMQEAVTKFAGKNALTATAATAGRILTAPIRTLWGGGSQIADAITGKEISPYSNAMTMTNYAQSTSEGVQQSIDEATAKSPLLNTLATVGYTAFTSMGDSLMAGLFGPLGLPMMGLDSAQQTVNDALENGATQEEAMTLGGVTGIIEVVTEKIPFDELLGALKGKATTGADTLRSAIKKIFVKSTGASATDAAGEMLAEWLGNTADRLVMGDKSQRERSIQEFLSTHPFATRETAEKEVIKNEWKQIAIAGLSGAISSGLSTTGGGLVNYGIQRKAEKATANAETEAKANGAYNDEQAQKEYADAVAQHFNEGAATTGETQMEGTMPQTAETPARSEKPRLNDERAVALTGEETAYEYGLTGRSQEDLQNTLEESGIEMTDAERVSFTKGETQRKQNVQKQVEYIKSLNKGGPNGSRKGTFRSISDAELEMFKDRGIRAFNGVFSDKQRAVSNALRGLAETMHMNIVYFESPTDENGNRVGANGFYDRRSNTIYLDVFAGKGNEQAMIRAAAHEVTHVIQEWSPEKYMKLQDKLFKYYYSTGKNTLNEMIQAQKDKAKANGMELTESEALDEVTADACEMMFSDIDAMSEIARMDRTLFEKIGEWINKFVDSIKTAMQGIRSSTEESRLLMESKETWENARKIWYQALEEVGQNNPGSVTETAKTVDQTAEIAENTQKAAPEREKSVVRIVNQREKKSGERVAPELADIVSQAQQRMDSGRMQYSLREFDDGTRFVDVQTEQNAFDGLSEKEQAKKALEIIKRKFKNRIVGMENRVFVNGRSAKEYAFPAKMIRGEMKTAKMKAAPELDNLVDAGVFTGSAKDGADGHKHEGIKRFDYYKTIFKVGKNYFSGKVNVMVTEDERRLLKDITEIKNITQDITGQYGEKPDTRFLRDVSMNSISENGESVNGNVQFSQRDTEYKTDRQLLASALEGVTKNAEEAQMLREYQEIAAKLDADERRVQEINERIRELRLEDVNTPEEQQLLEERKGLEKGITTADRRLFQMERLQPLQRIAKIQRREAEEALQKARRHLERYKEGVIQREYIGKIKRTSDRLAKWLTKPNNQRYVPEDLRRPLAEFLLAIDRGSETMLTGGGMTQADRDYARVIADLRDVVSNISAYQNDQSESGKVYSMYIDLPRGFVEMMTEHARKMDAKTKEMGGRMTLNRMNAQELEELFMTLTAISSSITHTNDFLSTESAKRVGEVAQDTIGYLREQKPIVTESKIGEFLNWDNLQPVYAFERYGEGGKQIFRMLQDGQSKLAFNTQEIVKVAEKLYTAKEVKEWRGDIKTFTIGSKEVRIPVANIMSLYCLMRRQQAIGHLYGEGIRVGDFKDGVKTVRDDGHNIGDADIARMVGSLTERQKDVAEKLQQVMSTMGSRWGNEISMKRFGYRMFTENVYFPIEVDRTHLPARTDNGRGSELYRLLNISSTKPITRGANNRIMINDIFDVFSSHMSDMAQYNAMALPVLDAVKWLNYKESEMEEVPIGEEKEYRQKYTESVRDAARDAYGYAANKYIVGVLRDINGAQMTGGEGYGKMMLGRVNRASVAANLRVAFLQPLSIIRAATVLKGTDILTGAGIGATHIKRNMKEMEEHSGIAVWKQLGFYDVNIGRSVSKLIKHDETKMDKLIDASMKGAEVADRMTWALMWEGAKRDVARTTSPGSEGFLDKVAERFEEVVYKTQVVDSVLTRSQYMRNPGFFAKWTSSFMSEPTTTYNILLNAYSKFTTEARNTNFQKAWQKTGRMVFRTMGVYTVTAAINAIVESLMGAWRDEDDYKTFMEKFQDGYYDNLINNLMPFNKLPLISDVYEYAKKSLALFGVDTYGYGDTNVITQWLDQLYDGLEIVADKVNGESTNYTEYGAIYKLMQGVSSLTGVPMASFMREVAAMWNNTGGVMTGRKIVVYKTSKSQGYQQMYNAIMDENTERTEQIRTELKENGAEDKNIISGLRSLAKQDYMAGNLTDDEAAAFLQKHCGMSADEAYWKLDEWAWDAEAAAEDYSVYNELEEALLTGTGISEAVKRLTDHGYEKSKVQSKVREMVKAGYLAGDLTQTKVTSLLKAHGGLTDNEAYFKQQQYEYERLTGDSTSSDACMIFYEIDNKRSPAKAIDAALKHGKTKSGLASSLTSRYKQQYLEMLKTNKSAAYQLATRLAGIFDYLGYEGTKKVQGWTETK